MNKSRAILIVAAFIIAFAGLAGKLFQIQILQNEEMKYLAERQQTTIERIKAERGLIYDRNNQLLVYNRNDISFYLDLRMASKKVRNAVAEKFSAAFKKPKSVYLNLMAKSKGTICIERKAPSEAVIKANLKNFKKTGLYYEEDPTRVYHYGNLASHLLGYVNHEYTGVNGIAKTMDDELNGEDGARLVERDALGDMLTVEEEETKHAQPGDNIVLTVDRSYQKILEEELKNGLDKYGGTSAVGIIMNPNTGEILALANMEDYDPNFYWKYSDTVRRNKAVTDVYEPGSTFKAITIAALFDQNLCREEETVFVENGRYRFKSAYISDTHPMGNITVQQVIEQSSNVGISKLVQRIDDELYYKYIRGFGFGNYTSIRLPGEVKGMLRKPGDWSNISKAFISFGYEISVTPLQLTSAFCALVNGGILYKPAVIKSIFGRDGVIKENFEPKQVRRVISEETSARMREILKGVVKSGTGKNAKIGFVTTGGKTGTSQKLIDGKYSKLHYNSSFVGFFPAESPKIVCYILVNSPTKGRYGGAVAAPIFKNVATRIVNTDLKYFQSPIEILDDKQPEIKYVEFDEQDDAKIVYANEVTQPETKKLGLFVPGKMPDLKGLSLRDAISLLNRLAIEYKISGAGTVSEQSIIAGSKVKPGMKCALTCEEKSIVGTTIY